MKSVLLAAVKHVSSTANPSQNLLLVYQWLLHNKTVAVDLHELELNVWYLHIIDHFTRFSAGCIVTSKKPSEIIRLFTHAWMNVHGAPRKLNSDNGGEFNNEEMRDMTESFNTEMKTTAAYSAGSNGLLERHNQTLTEVLFKVKQSSGQP